MQSGGQSVAVEYRFRVYGKWANWDSLPKGLDQLTWPKSLQPRTRSRAHGPSLMAPHAPNLLTRSWSKSPDTPRPPNLVKRSWSKSLQPRTRRRTGAVPAEADAQAQRKWNSARGSRRTGAAKEAQCKREQTQRHSERSAVQEGADAEAQRKRSSERGSRRSGAVKEALCKREQTQRRSESGSMKAE